MAAEHAQKHTQADKTKERLKRSKKDPEGLLRISSQKMYSESPLSSTFVAGSLKVRQNVDAEAEKMRDRGGSWRNTSRGKTRDSFNMGEIMKSLRLCAPRDWNLRRDL